MVALCQDDLRHLSRRAAGHRLEQAIRAAMLRRKLTVVGLARAAGIQRDTLYNWFEGKTAPRTAELGRVADVLGVSVGELLRAYQGLPAEAMTLPPEVVEALETRIRRVVREELEAALRSALVFRGRDPR